MNESEKVPLFFNYRLSGREFDSVIKDLSSLTGMNSIFRYDASEILFFSDAGKLEAIVSIHNKSDALIELEVRPISRMKEKITIPSKLHTYLVDNGFFEAETTFYEPKPRE